MRELEHIEQTLLFQWAELATGKHPELAWMFAVPNGGHRHVRVAMKMKREGVKPGVPDIIVPAVRGEHHGLYLEMKEPGRRPKQGGAGGVSAEQRKWHEYLRGAGYAVFVCYGWEDARDVIERYLELAPGRRLSDAA